LTHQLATKDTVCACFVLDQDSEWPTGEGLWQVLEKLCNTWLIVVTGLNLIRSQVSRFGELSTGFEGRIIYNAAADDPHETVLLAAMERSSHLWLLESSSVILAPTLFQFSELRQSHYIVHGFNAKELQWRRSLVSTQHEWRYEQASHQWEPANDQGGTDYLKQIKVELNYSDDQRVQHAVQRQAKLLSQIEGRTAGSIECKDIAQCFEALSDNPSAASWYHKGAWLAQEEESVYAYCSYRYWCLVQSLTGSSHLEEWQQRWLELFEHWPDRLEPLYQLIQLYIESEDWEKAWSIVQLALEIDYPQDDMPYEGWMYEYGLFYQAAQCAYAREDDQNVLKYSVAAKRYKYIPEQVGKQLYQWQTEAYARTNSYFSISRDEKNHFVVIIPFRNCVEFLQDCIDSLKVQRYRYFEVIFVDDASTDGGLENCDLSGLPAHTILQREESVGAISNQMDVLQHHTDPSDVAVFLDGDDQLVDEAVLGYLNKVYSQTGCWFTYGQFSFDDSSVAGYARPILESESISSLFLGGGFKFPVHMRTHRAGLMAELLKQDPDLECMKGKDGCFVQYASDVAHVRAIMMITPRERIRYIARILYRYNTHNPNSHFKTKSKIQQFHHFIDIGRKPELCVVEAYSPFAVSSSKAEQ